MTVKQFEASINANGEFEFPAREPNRRYVVELSGTFGTAAVTLGYVSTAGTFVAYEDSAGDPIILTANAAWELVLPRSGKFAVSVATAGGTSLTLTADVLP